MGDRIWEFGPVLVFVALFVLLAIESPVFATKANWLNILDSNSATGIIACGETVAIISGNFDLSVGAVYSLAGVIAVTVTNSNGPVVGCLVAVGAGLAVGLSNGVVVSYIRVNSFIATLASQYIVYGLALLVSGAVASTTSPGFAIIGNQSGLGVPYTVWVLAGIVVLTGLVLWRTTWGRRLYSVGGNKEASRLLGIRVRLVPVAVFAVSGCFAAIAGVIDASRVSSAEAGSGTGLVLTSIAAVIIGGTSIFGGEGAIWRTVLGFLLLGMIVDGFDLLSLNGVYEQVTEGTLILIAVVFDVLARRQNNR